MDFTGSLNFTKIPEKRVMEDKKAYKLLYEIVTLRKSKGLDWLEKQRETITIRKNKSGEWLLNVGPHYFTGESLLGAVENAMEYTGGDEK